MLAELDDRRVRPSSSDRAPRLADGLRDAFADAGVDAQVTARLTLAGVFFSADTRCTTTTTRAPPTTSATRAFFHGLLDRGVFLAPSGFETLFPSLAHTDADIDRTVEAAGGVLASLSLRERD